MTNAFSKLFMISVILITCLHAASKLPAQERFVEVVGKATMTVPPNTLEIQATISASGETAKAAIRAFEESKDTFASAMGKMNFPDATVQFKGPTFTNAAMMQQMGMIDMMGGDPGDEFSSDEYSTQEVAIISFPIDVKDMKATLKMTARVIDSATAAKAVIGDDLQAMMYGGQMPGPIATPKHSDMKKLEAQVLKQAVEDARKQAVELAELANCSVGDVISLKTVDLTSEFEIYGYDVPEMDSKIQITKRLAVRFQLTDPR